MWNETTRGGRRWLWLRHPTWIFLIAAILRIGVSGVIFEHTDSLWGVNESAGIARSLVEGRGFAGAFHDASGPTAWLAPIYPALLACVFRFLGVRTAASAVAAVLLNAVFSSLTAVVLVQLGKENFGETAGLTAGWAWALAPPLLFMPLLIWETCLSGLILTIGFMALLRLGHDSRAREWVQCGAIWSFAALLNPALLAPLPALALEAAWRSRRRKGPALMILVCCLGVLPWTARNFRVFGRIMPIRSNFWPEFYFGNIDFSVQPIGNAMLYQQGGEISYANDLKARSLNFVVSNPPRFARLTGERLVAFWTRPVHLRPYPLLLFILAVAGMVLAWRRRKRWIAYGSVLLLYPLVYYITYVFVRHRYPIEPLMYILSAYFLCDLVANRGHLRQHLGGD